MSSSIQDRWLPSGLHSTATAPWLVLISHPSWAYEAGLAWVAGYMVTHLGTKWAQHRSNFADV